MVNVPAVEAIVKRAEQFFAQQLDRVHRQTDRMFLWLMIGQWVFGIVIAVAFSPYGWEGKTRAVNIHIPVALLLGGGLSALPIALILLRPGWVLTRHVVAAAQMMWSALLIHLSGGRIETHFHVFGSLAFLAFYRDWRVLVTATVVVAADHFGRGVLWPESVYGIVNPEWWRFLEHAFWVLFCDTFLVLACVRGVDELRNLAERQAQIEAVSEGEWKQSSVVERGPLPSTS
jgi:hypothetical protein